MSRKLKDSGIPWIGQVPEGWKVSPAKHVLQRNDGGVWGNDPTGSNDSLVLRSTEQTIDGKWNIVSPAKRDLSDVSGLDRYLIEKDDILVTKSSGSAFHIGKATIAGDEVANLNCYYSNFLQRLRVNSEMLLPRIMWYFLNSTCSRDQFVFLQNSTSGIGNINGGDIAELYIPLPPLSEQKAIADFLDGKCAEIDGLREKIEKQIATLEEYKKSLITESVTRGLDPNAPMKDSGVPWIGQVPEGWKVVRFKDHAFVRSNLVPPEKYLEYPQVSPDCIEKGSGRLLRYATVEESGVESGNHLFKKGQIIYSKIRPILNKLIIAPFDGLCSADMYPIETDQNVFFVKYLMLSSSFVEQVALVTQDRIKMPKINQEELAVIRIPIPPLSEQKAIAEFLDGKCAEIDAETEKCRGMLERLEEYKKALIFECVTGKKEVV